MSGRGYWKQQTKWARIPAAIDAYTVRDTLAIRVHHDRASGAPPTPPAIIFLDAREAQGFASWLSREADRLMARQAKAEARRLARAAAKKGGAK